MENNFRHADDISNPTPEQILQNQKIDEKNLMEESNGHDIPVEQLMRRSTDNLKELKKGIGERAKRLYGFTETEKNITSTDQETTEVVVENAKNTHELAPEETEELLNKLEIRFNDNSKLHKGVEFSKVKNALIANKKALLSAWKMEKNKHEPDILQMPNDKEGFYIITGSKESPESGLNCVYDQEAEDYLKKNYPERKVNGNAVTQAENMGIGLESEEQYRYMQTLDNFDEIRTGGWLKTPDDMRKGGAALRGFRRAYGVLVTRDSPKNHAGSRAWRGSLRVLWN